jgi:hypothetical protein
MKNKIPKFPLINGLWIGHTYDPFPKLTPIEESLTVHYHCRITLTPKRLRKSKWLFAFLGRLL